MADQDQGASIIAQKAFEPECGFEVEVVGRLVEQQQIGLGEQDRGERHPHPPAARQIADRLVLRPLVEPEPGEDACRPARCGMRVDLDEPRLDLGGAQRLRPSLPLGQQARSARGRRRAPSRAGSRPRSAPPGRESRCAGRAAIRSSRHPAAGRRGSGRAGSISRHRCGRPARPWLLRRSGHSPWSSSRRPVRPPTRYVTSERVSMAVF